MQGSQQVGQDEGEKGGLSPSQIGILQLNNLTFKLEPDLAVVVQRNTQSSFFLSQQYAPGSTMTAIINAGSSFVNLRQSSLIIDVTNSSATAAWFGVNGGSACNFISRLQIIAKNGVVLERIDNANQLASTKVNYQYSKSWKDSVGSLMGMSAPDAVPVASVAPLGATQSTANLNQYLSWAAGQTQRFVIPLYVFSTLCDSMGSLCPSQLISGARFEILLESPANSMISVATATSASMNYAITACRLELESYLLTDSVMKVINQVSATQGLEVIAATSQNTQSNRNSSQLVVDVARSCSRALHVLYKERPAPGANAVLQGYATGALFDPMASPYMTASATTVTGYQNLPKEWQVRAGQLYFPQSSIRGGQTPAIGQAEVELFMQTVRSYQKLNSGSMGQNASCSTTLAQFRGAQPTVLTATNGAAGAGMGRYAYGLDLQRSAILTSGIPLSNSHQLSIMYNTQYGVDTGTIQYLVDVFLTYQICIRTFLSQAVVEV